AQANKPPLRSECVTGRGWAAARRGLGQEAPRLLASLSRDLSFHASSGRLPEQWRSGYSDRAELHGHRDGHRGTNPTFHDHTCIGQLIPLARRNRRVEDDLREEAPMMSKNGDPVIRRNSWAIACLVSFAMALTFGCGGGSSYGGGGTSGSPSLGAAVASQGTFSSGEQGAAYSIIA